MSARSAAAWAASASATDVRVRTAELDRRALASTPAYLRRVEALASDAVEEIRAIRTRRIAELRGVDPGAAAGLQRSGWRTVSLLASLIAAAGAFAAVFSRAAFDLETALPWIVVALAVAVAGMAGSLLPLRADVPPTSGAVAVAWVPVVLGVASLVGAWNVVGGEPGTAPWFVAGAVASVVQAALAVGSLAVRRRMSGADRSRQDERLGTFGSELGREASAVIDRAADRVRDLFAELPAADRARADGEVAAAYRELERRGMVAPGTAPHVPGLLILDRTATAAAASIGAKGAPVLVALPAATR
ncbi:hypothetical protein EV187_2656 [Agromyces ramosus]|uniref:Uncharacterized protein n=1 Tax=Agromyces ramosus TaxID=33879 RepID=A0A4Q7M8E1_9MICO|nr:hypothetical protein [Agromyces ramosus]RZS64276.1 hypothetical protein EV187_2656 [Agromyces ramosus]